MRIRRIWKMSSSSLEVSKTQFDLDVRFIYICSIFVDVGLNQDDKLHLDEADMKISVDKYCMRASREFRKRFATAMFIVTSGVELVTSSIIIIIMGSDFSSTAMARSEIYLKS